MRVALVGPYPLDFARVEGGVETSLMALATALAQLPDVEPIVLTFVPGLEARLFKQAGEIPVTYLPAPRRLRSATLHLRERRTLRHALDAARPEVVHAQDTLQYGFVCLKADVGAPVVATIHGIAREEAQFAPNWSTRLRFVVAGASLQRYCIHHARYLTQSTRYPEQYFGAEIRGRIWDIANPIPDRFFDVDPAPEPGRIVYAGAVIPRKRLLDLVEALRDVSAAVPSAHVHVAGGEFQSEYAERVRARAREIGVHDRVILLGPRSPAEMVEEYRRASVFVLPSGQETSPLAIGEAMAAALPVVATDVGGVSSLVDEGVTGHVVAAGDVGALADRLTAVLGDPSLAFALGEAGRAKANRSFRLEVVSKQMRALYEEAISGT